jgi:hypothetical protein
MNAGFRDIARQIRAPLAANSDPASSHIAAAEITANGTRAAQKLAVLEALKSLPGSTSMELAQVARLDRHRVARRLPDLEADGLVRRGACAVTGRQAITWRAEEAPEARRVEGDTPKGGAL